MKVLTGEKCCSRLNSSKEAMSVSLPKKVKKELLQAIENKENSKTFLKDADSISEFFATFKTHENDNVPAHLPPTYYSLWSITQRITSPGIFKTPITLSDRAKDHLIELLDKWFKENKSDIRHDLSWMIYKNPRALLVEEEAYLYDKYIFNEFFSNISFVQSLDLVSFMSTFWSTEVIRDLRNGVPSKKTMKFISSLGITEKLLSEVVDPKDKLFVLKGATSLTGDIEELHQCIIDSEQNKFSLDTITTLEPSSNTFWKVGTDKVCSKINKADKTKIVVNKDYNFWGRVHKVLHKINIKEIVHVKPKACFSCISLGVFSKKFTGRLNIDVNRLVSFYVEIDNVPNIIFFKSDFVKYILDNSFGKDVCYRLMINKKNPYLDSYLILYNSKGVIGSVENTKLVASFGG